MNARIATLAAILVATAMGCATPPPAATATLAQLRIRNEGPASVQALHVQFPAADVDFGDVAAGASTAYRPVPGGIYNYAAYRARIDGREVALPVIDWVGEAPLPAGDITYVIAVDAAADLPVRLVRVERDRP